MKKIRLTREFSFEMAHVLDGYDGPCSRVHGHSYRLLVTVRGVPSADPADPKQGMVMDFGVLKKIVNELIVSRLDHAFLTRESLGFQPTCENLVLWFVELLTPAMPTGVELFALRLHETANSYAEWFREDNVTSQSTAN